MYILYVLYVIHTKIASRQQLIQVFVIEFILFGYTGSTQEDEGVSVTVVILVPVFLCILTFILATSFNCILHKLCSKAKRLAMMACN